MKKTFIVEVDEGVTLGCETCKIAHCCIAHTDIADEIPFLSCSKYNLDTLVMKEFPHPSETKNNGHVTPIDL